MSKIMIYSSKIEFGVTVRLLLLPGGNILSVAKIVLHMSKISQKICTTIKTYHIYCFDYMFVILSAHANVQVQEMPKCEVRVN